MAPEIQENVSEFIIQGFSDTPNVQIPIFILFLVIYIFIVIGNLIIFLTIMLSSDLHRPMYKFLQNSLHHRHLLFLDILPALLRILITKQNKISFFGCMTQLYLYTSLAGNEFFLLTVMAYDRYVAICDPLHYINRMNKKNCDWLISAAYFFGFVTSAGHVIYSKLSYCKSHLMTIFLFNLYYGTLLSFNSFLLTLISYIYIISTILKIQSTQGRQKAFSTCASH
ncbi:hypothetical protein GDO86_013569 [Hymenochirus boettgeri]|uniref:G-protein coupled receptors family 1 profile domain-containing protein n=1 Tax=Hymenochirus boettgeri TaxID=247094 RepID=A0A8T2IRY3_9PIPI|nr:hypothetical protein GDO86_013569 [Hymenochirus boettgeri]